MSLAVVSLGGVSACGGAQSSDLHEAFAAIQVEEARIVHALARESVTCSERELACDEVGSSTAQICSIASASDDRDARARCDRAEAHARACSLELTSRCGHGDEAPR